MSVGSFRVESSYDPLDSSPYKGLKDTDVPRCKVGGLCESWKMTCAMAKILKDPGGEEDCSLAALSDAPSRAEAVKQATVEAWAAYKSCAWGADNLKPLTCNSSEWFGLGLTLVDGLSTLKLMGLQAEFEEGARWVASNMSLSNGMKVNVFETTIRVIGGLLSAYSLARPTDDPDLVRPLLEKAVELGARLLPSFELSPSGIPLSDVNLTSGDASSPTWTVMSSISEATTLSLEWTLLSRYSGNPAFEEWALKVHTLIAEQVAQREGLVPWEVNPMSAQLAGRRISLGARADSYYEYLLKQWIHTGKTDRRMLDLYVQAMRSVRSRLVRRTTRGLWFLSELSTPDNQTWPKMDHLACFVPGNLALGHLHGVDTRVPGAKDRNTPQGMSDLRLAQELVRSCYEGYRGTPSGLAPEIWHWIEMIPDDNPRGLGEFVINSGDEHNLLRPETAESIYLMWKATGDPKYREWAWSLFRAFQRWGRVRPGLRRSEGETCEVAGPDCTLRGQGYARLDAVVIVPPPQRNGMDSFFIAETLKYLWLTNTDAPDACAMHDCVSPGTGAPNHFRLDAWVFNTEAHPLPLAGPATSSRVARVSLDPKTLDPYAHLAAVGQV